MTAILDEDDWIKRASAGDTEAFASLCALHRNRLWRVVSSVAPAADREDLAQETIVRAFRSLSSYSGEASFAAWLCRIAVNCAHDYRKSGWRRRVVSLFDNTADQAIAQDCLHDDAERREMQRQVRQAVADLAEKHRVPIWLHFFDGFSIAEISRLQQIPEATIRGRIQAGIKRLAPGLRDWSTDSTAADAAALPGAKSCKT